ncbi:hypothetical protein [Thalassospira australica]|uniref:hypothetical protein n=1 Tax=Thalassospira australica TaxID=1528106 RepID=UPI0038514D98
MSFTKFMDLVAFDRCFFSSVANLQKEDPLEGRFPEVLEFLLNGGATRLTGVVDGWARALADNLPKVVPLIDETWEYASPFGAVEISPKFTTRELLGVQANWIDIICWHTADVESMAMWKIYGGNEPSVCLVSTIDQFCRSIRLPETSAMVIGKVEYEDLRDGFGNIHDTFTPYFLKSRHYAYEHELRAIVFNSDDEWQKDRSALGCHIPVDLSNLISQVILSPNSPDWFLDLVTKLVSAKVEVDIKRSDVGVR